MGAVQSYPTAAPVALGVSYPRKAVAFDGVRYSNESIPDNPPPTQSYENSKIL